MYDAFCKLCLHMDSSIILMLMNHGTEAHTTYTIALLVFFNKNKKHETTFTT